MAISTRKYIQVPPDSSGKRVGNYSVLHLAYNTRTETISIADIVTGGTSGTVGTVLEVIEVTAAVAGTLVLKLEGDYVDDVYSSGENLIVNSVTAAIAADAGVDIYYNEMVLVGGNDPTNKQFIDESGAQNIRFPEGAPVFNSFGMHQSSNIKSIADYDHVDRANLNINSIISGSATSAHVAIDSLQLLTNTAGVDDLVQYRSNIWHKYEPGQPLSAFMTLVCGDSGKNNLIRRWGLFDDDDGIFFEQSGSVLSVVQRSSVGGSISEIKTEQSAWNGDKLDGSGGSDNLSRITLDPTKANIYYIDLQWLGAGVVRFALHMEGKRTVVHSIENPNTYTRPYMRKASLPVTFEQQNVGATSGTSEMRVICAAVQSSDQYAPEYVNRAMMAHDVPFTASTGMMTPVMSFRPSALTPDGIVNRNYYTIKGVEIFASEQLMVGFVKSGSLSTPTWISGSIPGTPVDIDMSSTTIVSGSSLYNEMISANTISDIDLTGVFNNVDTWLTRKSDINADPDPLTLVAMRIFSGSAVTGSMSIAVNYSEFTS